MLAGKLRHRIAVQSRAQAANAYGEIADTWATDATVWGSIEPLTGEERLVGDAIQAQASHRVRLRYRAMTPRNRLLFGTRVFEVVRVDNPGERGAELDVLVRETVT